jgi:hypothetical protein
LVTNTVPRVLVLASRTFVSFQPFAKGDGVVALRPVEFLNPLRVPVLYHMIT